LKSGAEVNRRSDGGLTALLFAVREGHQDVVKSLIAGGASVNEKAPDGTAPLMLALINAHWELAVCLLDNGADANAADPRSSALHVLAFMRRPGRHYSMKYFQPVPTGRLTSLDLAKALIRHGADVNNRISWKEQPKEKFTLLEVDSPKDILVGRCYLLYGGATPYYLAAKHSDTELMRLLLSNGADPLIATVDNVTPLMAAAGLGYWPGERPGNNNGVTDEEALEAVKLAYENDPRVDNTVKYFGDVQVEGDGVTLRWSLALNKNYLDRGDIRWGGSTVMHGAAARGVNGVVRFLFEKG